MMSKLDANPAFLLEVEAIAILPSRA